MEQHPNAKLTPRVCETLISRVRAGPSRPVSSTIIETVLTAPAGPPAHVVRRQCKQHIGIRYLGVFGCMGPCLTIPTRRDAAACRTVRYFARL